MALEYRMRIDFDAERWFQVALTPELQIEFKLNPNTLVVSLTERRKILAAVNTAVEALQRYQSD